ncbi:DMT family transporter [Albidovulum sp.]
MPPSDAPRSDNLRGAILMTLAMLAFTANDACMKIVTRDLPLFEVVLARGVLTSLLLLALARHLGGIRLRLPIRERRLIGLRTLGEVLATVTFLAALRQMPLANISAIMQILPLAVTLAAALILREPVGWRRMLAILAGFAGVMLIVRPGGAGFNGWSLVALLSVACVVLRDLSTRQLGAAVTSVTVALSAAVSVTVVAALAAPFQGFAPIAPAQAGLIALAALLLVGGHLFIVMAMRVGEVALVAPFRYAALVFAILLGWLVFGDLPGALTLIGAAVVVGAGLYAFWRERRLGRRVAAAGPPPLRLR